MRLERRQRERDVAVAAAGIEFAALGFETVLFCPVNLMDEMRPGLDFRQSGTLA